MANKTGTAAGKLPKTAEIGDNSEAAARAARQDELLRYTHQHRKWDAKIAEIKLALDDAKAERKLVRDAIAGTGILLEIFDAEYKLAGLKVPGVELEDREEQRTLVREAFGLPMGQGNLFGRKDKATRDLKTYWEAEGYRYGIMGLDPQPPGECPPDNGQDFMRGYSMATERNAKALKGPEKPAAPEGGGQAGEGDGFEATDEELKSQAGRKVVQEQRASAEGDPALA